MQALLTATCYVTVIYVKRFPDALTLSNII
jgi:hypothetical protein